MLSRAAKKTIALLLLTSCCLTGCWDLEEITALAPVAAIGIDQGSAPNLLRVSAQLSLPEAGGGGGAGGLRTRLRVLTVESESLIEAFAMLQSRTRRRHFFLHLNHIIFGAELARSGVGTATEAVQAWPQIRGSTLVFVAEEEAEKVLHAHSGIGKDPASDIADIIRSITTAPVARKMTLHDMVNALSTPGSTSLTLPILGLVPLELSSADETPPTGVGQDGEQFKEATIKGTALFERDRWVEELDVRETQTLAILVGQARQGMSTMQNPVNAAGTIAPQYEGIRTSYMVKQLPSGQVQIVTKLKIDIRLVEIHGGYDRQLVTNRPIEAAVEQDATTRLTELFRKLQSYGLDSINIGQRIKQQNPKLWRQIEDDWPQVYQELEFRAETKAAVRTLGLVKYFMKLGE